MDNNIQMKGGLTRPFDLPT